MCISELIIQSVLDKIFCLILEFHTKNIDFHKL